jgi:acyl carrier protein
LLLKSGNELKQAHRNLTNRTVHGKNILPRVRGGIMAPTRKEVSECVIECLLEMSSDQNPPPIDEQTNPMWKLGLDSHDGVNLACKLTERLNYDIPKEINPLVDDEQDRPRRVGEIISLVCGLIATGKEQNHG